jgi:hypothetical protein
LERELQLLKRAIKIKAEREREREQGKEGLEQLADKWVMAGREAAWECWGLLKGEVEAKSGQKWGWGEESNKDGMKGGWGWEGQEGQSKREDEDDGRERGDHGGGEEEERKDDDVGTMLRHLRIDPATLGWDEDEGDFVDKSS